MSYARQNVAPAKHLTLGHKIESVAWCRTASGPSTGPVLVGTSRGLIIECSMEAGDESKFFGGSVDQYFKQVYNFAKGEGKSKCLLWHSCLVFILFLNLVASAINFLVY